MEKVVHRKPVPFMPYAHVPDYLLCHVIETLECGHQVTIYPQADPLIAKYRRCPKCESKVIEIGAAKKPALRVQAVVEKKIA